MHAKSFDDDCVFRREDHKKGWPRLVIGKRLIRRPVQRQRTGTDPKSTSFTLSSGIDCHLQTNLLAQLLCRIEEDFPVTSNLPTSDVVIDSISSACSQSEITDLVLQNNPNTQASHAITSRSAAIHTSHALQLACRRLIKTKKPQLSDCTIYRQTLL